MGAFLLFLVPIGVAGLTLSFTGGSMPAGMVRVGQVVLAMLLPALLCGAIFYGPRAVRAVRELADDRRAEMNSQPTGPPIEHIAADLRRLLWRHDVFARSDDIAVQAQRLWALEVAIADRATLAARALGVPHPDRPALRAFDKPELRRLLRTLAAEGLVLPPAVRLLAPDSRF
jgi:hypothetical protein